MKSYMISDIFKTHWSELTTDEMAMVLIYKSKLDYARHSGEMSLAGLYAIRIMQQLRKHSAVGELTVEQAVDCINDLSFIADPWFMFPDLGVSSPFEAPPTHLKHHTLGQLYWMDSLFSKFIIQDYIDRRAHPPQDPSAIAEMYLDEMIGVIYTSPPAFDERLISTRGNEIKKMLTHSARTVILYSYANTKKFIIDEFPLTFPTREDDDETGVKAPVDSEPMWQSIVYDLSESPAYPGTDKAKAAPMYEALNYLERKHKEQQKRKSA